MPRFALDLNVKSIVFVTAATEEEALTLARGLKGHPSASLARQRREMGWVWGVLSRELLLPQELLRFA
jgi:hypothetical protein